MRPISSHHERGVPDDDNDSSDSSSSSSSIEERPRMDRFGRVIVKHSNHSIATVTKKKLQQEQGRLGLNIMQDTGKEPRKCVKKMLLVDSRDRDIAAYPSANRFDVFLGDRMKQLKSVELVSIMVPLAPPPFADRYVVLAEDHCEDALMFADRVPFGYSTTLPGAAHKTGCSFPRGSLAMIQLVPNAFASTVVVWNSSNISRGWKSKLRGDATNMDRLSFSLWCWDVSAVPQRYPLTADGLPPILPLPANNYTMTLRMHYHD